MLDSLQELIKRMAVPQGARADQAGLRQEMLLKKGILKPKEEAAKTKASFNVSPPGGIVGEAICVCQFLHRLQRRKWLQSERAFGLNCPRETPRQPLPILGSTSQALPSEAGQRVDHVPPAKHTQKQKHILILQTKNVVMPRKVCLELPWVQTTAPHRGQEPNVWLQPAAEHHKDLRSLLAAHLRRHRQGEVGFSVCGIYQAQQT